MLEFLVPLLEGLGAGSAGGLAGGAGLANILGGGAEGLGTMAGTPMATGMGPTQGSGLMGVLSGGNLGALNGMDNFTTAQTTAQPWKNPDAAMNNSPSYPIRKSSLPEGLINGVRRIGV